MLDQDLDDNASPAHSVGIRIAFSGRSALGSSINKYGWETARLSALRLLTHSSNEESDISLEVA